MSYYSLIIVIFLFLFHYSFFIVICAVLWMKYPLYICLKFHFRFLRYFYFLWSRFLLLHSFWCQWLSSNVWWSLVICLYIKWVSNRFYKLFCVGRVPSEASFRMIDWMCTISVGKPHIFSRAIQFFQRSIRLASTVLCCRVTDGFHIPHFNPVACFQSHVWPPFPLTLLWSWFLQVFSLIGFWEPNWLYSHL